MKTRTMISALAMATASMTAGHAAWAEEDTPAGPATPAPGPTVEQSGGDIVVTGTRATGLHAEDSPAPILVVGADALSHTGQPNLIQSLAQLVPSFTAESFGGDTANLTLSARLRGLSPNQTLVLVNGKRRHGTANLHVLGGPYQGAASPDIDLIPAAAIDHIEVLQDGAAAQYGSDAIAGVINIILKKDSHGGMASITGGQYYAGDGETLAETARIALPIGDNGYFDLTAFHRYHNFSQRGEGDRRISRPDGTLLSTVPAYWSTIAGYPRLNRIVGDAHSVLSTAFFNAGYDFGGVEIYSFGSYGRRVASAYENYRVPSRVSRTVGGVTTLFSTVGFEPREALVEDDFSITTGIKADLSGWTVDLGETYGQDKNDISTLDSANASLFADTGFTPTNFYDGQFKSTQFTVNLDVTRPIEVGFAQPITFAFGGEYRRDTYGIKSGDAGSIYKEGGQSYPGFQPTDAGSHGRDAFSGYVDISAKPVEAWTIDVAGRYENYSGFGGRVIGKLTSRYDFSSAFALRGTVSTGIRAPTLAESYYSATNVSPTSAVVQLPPNSAAAAILGFKPLSPEKSTSFSAGLVAHPAPKLTISLDAYQVRITDRIAATGTILDTTDPRVSLAIAAHGNVLDPLVTFRGVSLFTNGVDTRTRGVELAISYPTPLGFGKIDWTLTGNYNKTLVTRNKLGTLLFSPSAVSNLETASPRYKVALGALFTSGKLTANLRETLYGKTSQLTSPSGAAPYYTAHIPTTAITDLELGYEVGPFTLAVGANNLFDKSPPVTAYVPGTEGNPAPTLITGGNVYGAPYTFSPYGINGGYYYGRVTVKF
jgi:iron complex outermembrane receptor protein